MLIRRFIRLVIAAIVIKTAQLGVPNSAHAHPGDGIVVDRKGSIYVVARNPLHDSNHHACIYRWKHDEEKPVAFYTSPHPSSNLFIVLGNDGYLYAAERHYLGEREGKDQFTTTLWRFESSGKRTKVLGPKSGRSPYGGPAYLVDKHGTIFYGAGEAILKRGRGSDKASLFFQTADRSKERRIHNLAWGPENTIYILYLDRVCILNQTGTNRTLCQGLKNLPFDIEVDRFGNVYLPDWRARRLLRISNDGNLTTAMTSEEPWGCEGVAMKEGNLWALEFTGPPATKIVPRLRLLNAEGTTTEAYRFPE